MKDIQTDSGLDLLKETAGTGAINTEDTKRRIKEAELSGAVVMVDMTASTDLKLAREFPEWVPFLLKFREIVHEAFPPDEYPDQKFLGDAFMIFIFVDEESKAKTSFKDRKTRKAKEILDSCRELMQRHWKFYSVYNKERSRGTKKPVAFREITCAIDFGSNIIDSASFFSDNGNYLDPVGVPVDRCFRISSIAAPGQLLFSEEFYQLLLQQGVPGNPGRYPDTEKISLAPDMLKGFPDVTHVYYSVPAGEIVKQILDPAQVELVEKGKSMAAKVKIRLLRNELKKRSTESAANEGGHHGEA